MPYLGINYGYTNEDVENLKKLHAEGLDNRQIAARLSRTTSRQRYTEAALTWNET